MILTDKKIYILYKVNINGKYAIVYNIFNIVYTSYNEPCIATCINNYD